MTIPLKKHPDIDILLTRISGRARISSIEDNICATCGKPAGSFRYGLSEKEYTISGMCQECQDSIKGITS